MPADDLRQQLVRVFSAELAEHLAILRGGLDAAGRGEPPDLKDLFRRAHSIKGAARAVEQPEVESLAHALEALLEQAVAAGRIAAGTLGDAKGLIDAIEDAADAGADPAAAIDGAADGGDDAFVRVSARYLDQLGASLQALREELDARAGASDAAREMRGELDGIRQACGAADASLSDISGRLARLRAASLAVAGRRSRADERVARAAADVEGDVERMLLVPAASLAVGLDKMVRDVAVDAGKTARLAVTDDGAEADRRVMQRLRDPLTQILRNAIAHGIEPPAARARAGKPEEGVVRLDIRADATLLTISIEDDGAGIDLAAVRAAAEARGLIDPAAPDPGEATLLTLLFEHGVSTAGAADRLSGRGVGLSVVAESVRRLNGSVRITPGSHGGARMMLTVPLTITRRPVLLVEAAGQPFAVPSGAVTRAVRVDPAGIAPVEGVASYRTETKRGARPVPIVPLGRLIGLDQQTPPGAPTALLIEREGAAVLLVVDALVDVRALALGDPAAIAARSPLILGTAAAPDGGVALVLSPDALLDRLATLPPALTGLGEGRPAAAPERRPTILVVDDSITTRTLERGILEGGGYRVLLAVDGVEGLARLRAPDEAIDLVVADVEMPRLDGFGLLAAIRNDPVLGRIPVVMMTSRDSPDDVRRGLDLGADAYVTKQSFEQGALIATVRRLI